MLHTFLRKFNQILLIYSNVTGIQQKPNMSNNYDLPCVLWACWIFRVYVVPWQCLSWYMCHVTPQCSNHVSTSLGISGLCWTIFAWNRDTAVPAEGNGDLQTLIYVLVARPRWCLTLSNPVPWQNWMAAYLGYTLRMKTLFCDWPVMVHDTHTRRRIRSACHMIIDNACLTLLAADWNGRLCCRNTTAAVCQCLLENSWRPLAYPC